eukprot:685751-Amphidinium_carterae.2
MYSATLPACGIHADNVKSTLHLFKSLTHSYGLLFSGSQKFASKEGRQLISSSSRFKNKIIKQ